MNLKQVSIFMLLTLGIACTHPETPNETQIKRIESDIADLSAQKAKLEGNLKEASNPEQNIQSEQDMELLKSRLERLNERLKSLKAK